MTEAVKIEWHTGGRDSVDGRWRIGAAHIRHGLRWEKEWELYDLHASARQRTAAVRSTPSGCRAAAQEAVDREATR